MMQAEEFMNRFMERLDQNSYEKDNQPNNGPDLNEDFVKQQVALYSEMLQTDVMRQVMEQL